jgi:hypothetical protein
MRKYLLPALVCAAIGAIVLLLVNQGERPRREHVEHAKTEAPAESTKPKDLLGNPAVTPTRLDEHKWLRELERALAEGHLDEAMICRQKVCEDMDAILANGKLTKDLLDTIRKYGVESDDLAQRDVVFPILRVFACPEATRIIAEEYYKAKNEDEQMTFLEAMSRTYHDPAQASVWAVDKALNSPSAEHRERAFDVMRNYTVDSDILCKTAMQIYDATTEPRMRETVLKVACERGRESAMGREFVRRVMRAPQGDDIMMIFPSIPNWGTEEDAARLEELANEYPAMKEALLDKARLVRRARQDERNQGGAHPEEMDWRRKQDEERRRLDAERKRREEEGGTGGEAPAEPPGR